MPPYSDKQLKTARKWFEDLKKALRLKGINLQDPIALSKIHILREMPDEAFEMGGRNTSPRRHCDILKGMRHTFDYAFVSDSATEFRAPDRKRNEIITLLKDKTKLPDQLSDAHIVYLYQKAKENRLWLRDFGKDGVPYEREYHIRVFEKEIKHDESKVVKEKLGNAQNNKPIYIGCAGISRDRGCYQDYFEKIKEEEVGKMTEEERDAYFDHGDDDTIKERIDDGLLLERLDQYSKADFEDAENKISIAANKRNVIISSRMNLDWIINNEDEEALSWRPKLRDAIQIAKKEDVEAQMLYFSSRFPHFFADKKNRKAFEKAAMLVSTDIRLLNDKEKDYIKKFHIIDNQYETVEKSLKKKFPGMDITQIMQSGKVTDVEGKPYTKKDPILFMNAVMGDVFTKGIYVCSLGPDGVEREELLREELEMGLSKMASISDYRRRFKELKKELESTNGNLTSNSPSYEELKTVLARAENILMNPDITGAVRTCLMDQLNDNKVESEEIQKLRRVQKALNDVSRACNKYMEAHSNLTSLSKRQRKRLLPMHGFRLLAKQFRAGEYRPSVCYKDLLAEKLVCGTAAYYYNLKGNMPNTNTTYKQIAIKSYTCAANHQRAVEGAKSGGILDEMLHGLTVAEKKALLQQDDQTLVDRFLETKNRMAIKEQNRIQIP